MERRLAFVLAAAAVVVGCSAPPAQQTAPADATPSPAAVEAPARTASAAWSPIDNARVHVVADAARRDQPPSVPPPNTAFLVVTLDGQVSYFPPTGIVGGLIPSGNGGYVVRIELKDVQVPPIPNPTSYPLAFPRPNVKRVLENDRVIVWDYTWTSGVPTPMHFHDKDVVVIYLEDGALRSTDPKGASVVNPHYFGFTKWNARDRVHTEELIEGKGRAIITELK